VRTLVAIITGGRPSLAERITARHLPSLQAAGFPDVEWVVREDQAAGYEPDAHPFNTYPVAWADSYARTHWRHPVARWEAGGFFGAFTGREWAMRTAEERGYDAVLQLDDNVKLLGLVTCTRPVSREVMDPGEMLSLLREFAASTNVSMLGAQLNSVPPQGKVKIIRAGYPYSVFIEKCGPGRMPWYGPYEDDVMHALEYALNGGPGRTAGVVELMRYIKDHGSKTGMRKHYDNTRGLELPRRYPNNASLKVSRSTSSPKQTNGTRSVRHVLNTRGFTPVKVTDPARYAEATAALTAGVAEYQSRLRRAHKVKMRKRGGLPAQGGPTHPVV
jgi:hypothetical protein